MKKCKVCGSEFHPTKPMQKVCSLSCALSIASLARVKRERRAVADDKRTTKKKLDGMKTKGTLIKEAQIEFNRYTRLRDAGKGCISCGAVMGESAPGGAGDAGHFRSRGSAPHLRFSEINCHLQCKRCNRYLSGNVSNYRLGLIERIGIEVVEALEADNTPRHYTCDDLRQIKSEYARKARELEKAHG